MRLGSHPRAFYCTHFLSRFLSHTCHTHTHTTHNTLTNTHTHAYTHPGSAGRPLTFAWTVVDDPYLTQLTTSELQPLVNAVAAVSTSSRLVVSNANLVSDRSYKFQLTVTNWLGESFAPLRSPYLFSVHSATAQHKTQQKQTKKTKQNTHG